MTKKTLKIKFSPPSFRPLCTQTLQPAPPLPTHHPAGERSKVFARVLAHLECFWHPRARREGCRAIVVAGWGDGGRGGLEGC